ncbi:MAG: SDR family NAD(P)-dependent oxidoreductase [Pseudomonadota bacterium]
MRVAIIGASGGIGRAMVEQITQRADIEKIYALSRSKAAFDSETVQAMNLDLGREESIRAAATEISEIGAPDQVILTTGILSDGETLKPEKSLRQQDRDAFETVFAVNTIGPALVAKHFIPIMPRKGRAVFAALSARVGSISDNRIGGWHAYRASKAALNMLIRNYAIEQARRNDQFIAVSLHPGTVDTALSKPFQSGVPEKQLFSPDQSASYLLSVIDALTPDQSGKAFDWAGQEIPA